MAETDPELGANLMVFFVRDWCELSQTPTLDRHPAVLHRFQTHQQLIAITQHEPPARTGRTPPSAARAITRPSTAPAPAASRPPAVTRWVRRRVSARPVTVAATNISEGTTVTFDMISSRDVPEQFVTSSVVKPDSASYVVNQKVLDYPTVSVAVRRLAQDVQAVADLVEAEGARWACETLTPPFTRREIS